MTARTWHKGPPPHVGWWNASTIQHPQLWRWWNGSHWSDWVDQGCRAEDAAAAANRKATNFDSKHIEWSDYYPADARVPRVDPRETIDGVPVKPGLVLVIAASIVNDAPELADKVKELCAHWGMKF